MGSTSASKPFPPGIHVPSLTWFADDKNQEIDWDTQNKHLEFLVKSGVHGSKHHTTRCAMPFLALPQTTFHDN